MQTQWRRLAPWLRPGGVEQKEPQCVAPGAWALAEMSKRDSHRCFLPVSCLSGQRRGRWGTPATSLAWPGLEGGPGLPLMPSTTAVTLLYFLASISAVCSQKFPTRDRDSKRVNLARGWEEAPICGLRDAKRGDGSHSCATRKTLVPLTRPQLPELGTSVCRMPRGQAQSTSWGGVAVGRH